jgi:hypothetical protein
MSDGATVTVEKMAEQVTVDLAPPAAVTVAPAVTDVTVEQAGNVAVDVVQTPTTVQVQPQPAAAVSVAPVTTVVEVTGGPGPQGATGATGATGPTGADGPPGPAGGSAVVWTNFDAGAHVLGNVVYLGAADGAKLAKADAVGTANAVGVCAQASVAGGATGNYQITGILAGLSGLVVNAVYYLSAVTAGLLTMTAPTTVGAWVVEIGVAVSNSELLIRPRLFIAL